MKKIFCTFSDGTTKDLDQKSLQNYFCFTYTEKLLIKPSLAHSKIALSSLKLFLKNRIIRMAEWISTGEKYRPNIKKHLIPKVSIRWISPEVGYGLFAEEKIPKDTYLGEYTGILSCKRDYLHINNYLNEYPLQSLLGTYVVIDAEKAGCETRFMNHSHDPNLEHIPVWAFGQFHKIFIAKKDIEKGQQLCYDYGKNYWLVRENPQNLMG